MVDILDTGVVFKLGLTQACFQAPVSSEVAHFDYLKRSLAIYRLAFGQPRQEDLVAFLANRGNGDDAFGASDGQLDLSPPDLDR